MRASSDFKGILRGSSFFTLGWGFEENEEIDQIH